MNSPLLFPITQPDRREFLQAGAVALAGFGVPAAVVPHLASAAPPVGQPGLAGRARQFTDATLVLDAGGHTARIWKVLFTPDVRQVISISDDKTIRLWNLQTGDARVLRPPIGPGDEGRRYAAALTPDGRFLAVGGHGVRSSGFGEIYLIELASGRITRVLEGHPKSSVYALAFSADGQLLGSGASDGSAMIWDLGANLKRPLRAH
jgi:WD40 repeat protein